MINVHMVLGLDRAFPSDFRRQAASALMHPVTLAALGVLLLNDLLFKAMWPGAWIPGKLSDLAWMMFAPPVLAYILSFATLGNARVQRAALVAAYAGLPLLYAAFNTFEPVHDAILRILGFVGGEGPRSPLDPTDSLVVPLAMAAALWVWLRPPLQAQSIRTRLALLAATAAALASVASSYVTDWGITDVGRTPSGTLGAHTEFGSYESIDGGLTWTKTSDTYVPLQEQDWNEVEVKTPSGDVFIVDGVYSQIIRERSEWEPSEEVWRDLTVRWGPNDHLTVFGASASREVVYSYEYLLSGGNRWMQALDKRDVENRVIATRALDLFYDDQSGNLIVAMGLQGVVVVALDGTSTRVAVGRYSPTDFSFGSKVRTYFGSLLLWEMAQFTGVAFMLTFSFATLALPPAKGSRYYFAFAAAISALLAVSLGVYPQVFQHPSDNTEGLRTVVLLLSGLGLFPLLLVITRLLLARTNHRKLVAVVAASIGMLPFIAVGAIVLFPMEHRVANIVYAGLFELPRLGPLFPILLVLTGLVLARPSRRQLLTVIAASIGMLLLIIIGALVLFYTGPEIANFVAIGLVGLATLRLWAHLNPPLCKE